MLIAIQAPTVAYLGIARGYGGIGNSCGFEGMYLLLGV